MRKKLLALLMLVAILLLSSCNGGTVVPGVEPSSLIPSANNTYDIGKSTRTWRSMYITNNVTVSGYKITFPSSAQTLVGLTTIDTLTNKTLTAPVINGVVTTTGLTLPAVTLGGTIDFAGQRLDRVGTVFASPYADFGIYGNTSLTDTTERSIIFKVLDATNDAWKTMITMTPNVTAPTMDFHSRPISNMVLGGNMTINGQTFEAGSGNVLITTTGSLKGLRIKSTQGGTNGTFIQLEHSSASPAINDVIGQIYAQGKDSNADDTAYGRINFQSENVTHTTECGKIAIDLAVNGEWNSVLTVSSAGDLWIDRNFTTSGNITLTLPIGDPHVSGQLYRSATDNITVMYSQG